MSTGTGVVRVDVEQEGSQGTRPKRRPTNKRMRVPQDDRVQSTARVVVDTKLNIPNPLSRSSSAVGAVARQIGSSSPEMQATGTSNRFDIVFVALGISLLQPDFSIMAVMFLH